MDIKAIEAAIKSQDDWQEWAKKPVGTIEHIKPISELRVEVVSTETASYDYEGPQHVTFKVTADGEIGYFKKTGNYTSYDGAEWDGAFVEATPKQITVYE